MAHPNAKVTHTLEGRIRAVGDQKPVTDHGTGRLCIECRCRLSRYNPDPICAGCAGPDARVMRSRLRYFEQDVAKVLGIDERRCQGCRLPMKGAASIAAGKCSHCRRMDQRKAYREQRPERHHSRDRCACGTALKGEQSRSTGRCGLCRIQDERRTKAEATASV